MPHRIANASTDGKVTDLHFGQVDKFHIQYSKLSECKDCSAFGGLCKGRVLKSDKEQRLSEFNSKNSY